MAKPTNNSRCTAFIELHNPICEQCNSANGVYKCRGCLKAFCEQHVVLHREPMKLELRELRRDLEGIRTDFVPFDLEASCRRVIEEINQWKQQSIRDIHRVAEEALARVASIGGDGGRTQQSQLLVCRDVFRTRLAEAERNNDYHERHLEYWRQFLIDLQKNFQRMQGDVRFELLQECLVRSIRVQSAEGEAPVFTKWCYFERNCGPCYDIKRSGTYETRTCCEPRDIPPCRDIYTEYNDSQFQRRPFLDNEDGFKETSQFVRRSVLGECIKE